MLTRVVVFLAHYMGAKAFLFSSTISASRSCCFHSIEVHNRSLGHDHEQSLEAIHADFDKVWNRYKVKDDTNPTYGPHLLRAVLNINAAHTPL